MTTATPTPNIDPKVRVWTAAELRRLPADERDAILAAAAAEAAQLYLTDPELTAFEAFRQDDLHGNSSDSRPR
jgi:hypothetical protein